MVERTYIVIIVAIIGALLIIFVFWPFGGSKAPAPKSTIATTITNGSATSGPTTTIVPVNVIINAINVQYVYSGPQEQNNNVCNYASNTYVDTGDTGTYNGSQVFYLDYDPSSSQCPMQITSVTVQTPGFRIVSVLPTLPYTIPPSSQAQIQVGVQAPDANFYGPMTISINYN